MNDNKFKNSLFIIISFTILAFSLTFIFEIIGAISKIYFEVDIFSEIDIFSSSITIVLFITLLFILSPFLYWYILFIRRETHSLIDNIIVRIDDSITETENLVAKTLRLIITEILKNSTRPYLQLIKKILPIHKRLKDVTVMKTEFKSLDTAEFERIEAELKRLELTPELEEKLRSELVEGITSELVGKKINTQKAISVLYEKHIFNRTITVLFVAGFTIVAFYFLDIFQSATLTELLILLTVLVLLPTLNFIQYLIVKYRIARNVFGFNPYEARKIMLFIQEESKDWDPPDDGSQRTFYPKQTQPNETPIPSGEGLAGEGSV